MIRSCAIVVVIAMAGCPGPAEPVPPTAPPRDAAVAVPDALPVPLDEDLPRLALRAVQLYEEVVRVFAASGTDCAAAADPDAQNGTEEGHLLGEGEWGKISLEAVLESVVPRVRRRRVCRWLRSRIRRWWWLHSCPKPPSPRMRPS